VEGFCEGVSSCHVDAWFEVYVERGRGSFWRFALVLQSWSLPRCQLAFSWAFGGGLLIFPATRTRNILGMRFNRRPLRRVNRTGISMDFLMFASPSPHPRIQRQAIAHLQLHTCLQRLFQPKQFIHTLAHRLHFRAILNPHCCLQYVCSLRIKRTGFGEIDARAWEVCWGGGWVEEETVEEDGGGVVGVAVAG